MFRCTSLVLPSDATILRESARPVEWRQPGYDEEFDESTLFYDVILVGGAHGNSLVFVGPPLLNLFPWFYGARIGDRRMATTCACYYLRHRCCDVWIPAWNGDTVQLDLEGASFQFTPQPPATHLYKDKRVLYTLSKDNEVAWIIDWVKFHVFNHGANAVLIYDNASTKYSGDALEGSLRGALPGLEINVVDWPYKYGPQGVTAQSGWDSDFCQAGAFQDARFRFLAQASSVLNCDIDELVVSERGANIFDATEKSPSGCTMFGGLWISNVTNGNRPDTVSPSQVRHGHFRHRERAQLHSCPSKWCVVPRRCALEDQWITHAVTGKDGPLSHSNAFSYRHLRGISTNWKYERSWPAEFDPRLHQFDEALDRSFARAGMSRQRARVPHVFSQLVRHLARSRTSTRIVPER